MMGEHVLRIGLNELTTVRIICGKKDCGGVIELPTETLEKLRNDATRCPVCGSTLAAGCGPEQVFVNLASSIRSATLMDDHFRIEFPVKLPG